MPQPEDTRKDALRRLQGRADALHARTAPTPRDYGSQAAGYGYRILGLLLGGVFVGIGFGAAVDAVAKTAPWGMIVGVLLGFGISIWLAVRSARAMADEASREWGPAKDLGPEDGEEDV
jgi:ATP synthase protein I